MAHEMLQEGDSFDLVAPAAIASGAFVLNAANTVILGLATRPLASGELGGIARKPGLIVNCDKAGATTFALGDPVNYVVATGLATSASITTGIIALGRCVEAAGNGPVKVKVACNFL
jgi:predicted RecA/RadA family phage recombinase